MAGENGGLISGGYNPLEAPDAPTSVSGSAGDESIDVSFTAPSDVGGAAIDTFIAVAVNTSSNESTAAEGSSSPITVSSLTNDVAHAISVYAKNTYGYSPAGTGDNVTPFVFPVGDVAVSIGAVANTGSGFFTSTDIQYIKISSLGNAKDFGDLTVNPLGWGGGTASNSIRAVLGGGYNQESGTEINVITYISLSSEGNASDFGDLTLSRVSSRGASNNTRGVFFTGNDFPSFYNVIDYVTIATTGNASDFGDLSNGQSTGCTVNSTTRSVIAGGRSNSSIRQNVIEYVTTASTGNASDFGDLTQPVLGFNNGVCCSSTRGVFAGGSTPGGAINNIEYIAIASTGNSVDFGDLTTATEAFGGASSTTRGLFFGGEDASSNTNVIQYITIASTGNAQDFGDLIAYDSASPGSNAHQQSGASSSHGGLS